MLPPSVARADCVSPATRKRRIAAAETIQQFVRGFLGVATEVMPRRRCAGKICKQWHNEVGRHLFSIPPRLRTLSKLLSALDKFRRHLGHQRRPSTGGGNVRDFHMILNPTTRPHPGLLLSNAGKQIHVLGGGNDDPKVPTSPRGTAA